MLCIALVSTLCHQQPINSAALPQFRNVSASEVLRNHTLQIDIYLLTYLLRELVINPPLNLVLFPCVCVCVCVSWCVCLSVALCLCVYVC